MSHHRRSVLPSLSVGLAFLSALCISGVNCVDVEAPLAQLPPPSYHFGAKIPVSCLNRSIDTGEHIQDEANNLQYIPFPVCNETGLPLELQYGVDTSLNCTIPVVTDPFFHLLEFYIHNDAPLTCRLPARPPYSVAAAPAVPADLEQEYVPLIFALAGTLQLSHLHVSTHLNILLHSVPKHHIHAQDSGVIDSGAAYSTSPNAHAAMPGIGGGGGAEAAHAFAHARSRKLVIGDPLPLTFDVRWFPTPSLPSTNGRYEWAGMGGHVYASTLFYCLVSFGAGAAVCTVWFWGVVLPKRVKGRGLGGATPLGYGGVGNGWGIGKRID